MAIVLDKFGFFNGIYGIEQSNWSNYWRGLIPDGIVAGFENEMQVYAQNDGMKVYVKTGQAMVDNHRAWSTSEKELTIATADAYNPRIDLVVLRIVYGNEGESKVYVDVKTGTASATPAVPSLIQTTGETYEIPLAEVLVNAGVVTIAESKVTDRRFIFQNAGDSFETFSGTTLAPENDREYRNGSDINSLTINLPDEPHPTFLTSVNFSSGSSFTAVTVNKGATTISGTANLKLKGDALTMPNKRYNLVIWWDGSYYWCASGAL